MADTPRRGIDPVDPEAGQRPLGDRIFLIVFRLLLLLAAAVVLWYGAALLMDLGHPGPIAD